MTEAYTPTVKQAEEILKKYVKDDFLLNHCKIVSGVMNYIGQKEEPEKADYWAAVGMLHDVDFELYPNEHCVKCIELLRNEGVDEEMIRSISSHGYALCEGVEKKPETLMEKTLFAVDELTGIIGAAALMRPSKSVADMEISSIKKKFKDKKFAAGCNRDVIKTGTENLGIPLEDLFQLTLDAMKSFENIYNPAQ